MNIKNFIKYIGLFVFGLLTALVIYPVIHEGSHTLVALISGAKVVDFQLLPLPSVQLNITSVEQRAVPFIGLAGALLPLILTIVIKSKKFWISYIGTLLSGICLMSFLISLIGLLVPIDVLIAQDDIVRVANMIPTWKMFLIILCVGCIVVEIIQLMKSGFSAKCEQYFL